MVVRLRRAVGGGVDKAIASAALFRVVTTLAGPLVALAILRFLSLEEQGYWYTFTSVMLIANYAELGLGQVIMQLVAHDWARGGADLTAKTESVCRIRSLFRLTILWGCLTALLVMGVALPLGWGVLSSHSGEAMVRGWQAPWILMALVAPLNLLLAFANSFFEGCQLVTAVNIRRAVQNAVTTGVTLACLLAGGKLWALGAAQLASFLVGVVWIAWVHGTLIARLWVGFRHAAAISWRREVWPLQSRYALTWVTGLFVFSLFNPLLFSMAGPQAAGRFGFTWSLVSVLLGFAEIWVTARAPMFAVLNAAQRLEELRALFSRSLRFTVVTYVAGGTALLGVCSALPIVVPGLSNRLLDAPTVSLLLVAQGINLLVLSQTYFARSFKEEPYLRVAWLNALLMAVLLPLGIHYFQTTGAVGAYLCSQLAVFPLAMRIYQRYQARSTAMEVSC